MSESYLVEITDAMQIPAVVYEAQERGTEQTIEMLLDHQEDSNVIRGYSQPLDGGIRRPDGGLSWYHNNTACYMRATPADAEDSKNAEETQYAWGEEMGEVLAENGYPNTEYLNADLYTRDSPAGPLKQIVGTSAYNKKDVRIERACWYEQDPSGEEFENLLEHDGIEPDKFYNSITVPETSILDYLVDDLEPASVDAEEFISTESMEKAQELQYGETGDVRGSCVLGTL